MIIQVSGKPGLWSTPHFYLCWNKLLDSRFFYVCTSNFFKLFADNTCNIKDVDCIHPCSNLPFKKETYIVLNESYNLSNIKMPAKFFRYSNAFTNEKFGIYKEKGLLARSFNIISGKYKII